MAYDIKVTPINKREVIWTLALDTSPNKVIAQDMVNWTSEPAEAAMEGWKTQAGISGRWSPELRKQAREALGETTWLADQAVKDAKQYARLHNTFSRSVTFDPAAEI